MNTQNGKKGDTMSKNPKIEGIVFRYGDDDYSFWMPDIPKEENTSEKQTKMLTRKFSKLSNMELHLSCAVAKLLLRENRA